MATYQFKINLPEEKPDYLEKLYKEWRNLARKKRKGIASILNQEIEAIWSDKDTRPPSIYLVPFRWDKIYIYVEIRNPTDYTFIKGFLSKMFSDTNIEEKEPNEFDLNAYHIFDKEAEFNKETEFTYSEEELEAIKKMGNCIKNYFFDFNIPGDNKEDMHELNWEEAYTSWKDHVGYRKEKKTFPYYHHFISANRMYSFVESEFYYVEFEDLDNFSVFFAFRLRRTPLTKITLFLDFHFKQQTYAFLSFLESNLIEYDFLYNEKIISIIERWIKKKEKSKPGSIVEQNNTQTKDLAIIIEEVVSNDTSIIDWESLTGDFEKNDNYNSIRTTLTNQQIRKFFSFLFKETNRTKTPFLSKKETIELLKYGFGVLEVPSGKYYTLNLDQKNKPNQIIFYCFSALNKRTSSKYEKEAIAKFLKFNFTNFRDIELNKIKNTIRSDRKPTKIFFDIDEYLP